MVMFLVLAFVVRLGSIFAIRNFEDPKTWEFGVIAQNIVEGKGFSFFGEEGNPLPSAYMPPIYPILLAGIFKVWGLSEISFVFIQLLQAFCGVLVCLLLFKIARKLSSSFSAWLVLTISAFYPPFLYVVTPIHPLMLSILISCLEIFLLLKLLEEQAVSTAAMAGLVGGLLALLRAEALGLLVLYSVWIVFGSKGNFKRMLGRSLLMLATAVVVLMPWIVRNKVKLGHFIPVTTTSGLNLWRGQNERATGTARDLSGKGIWPTGDIREEIRKLNPTPDYEVKKDAILRRHALQFMTKNPGKSLGLAIKKFFYFWTVDLTHPIAKNALYLVPSLLLSLGAWLGIFLSVHHLHAGWVLLYLQVGFLTLVAMIFFVLPRYRIFLDPTLILLAAHGVDQVFGQRVRPWLAKIVVL
jgi:hypothetical protein